MAAAVLASLIAAGLVALLTLGLSVSPFWERADDTLPQDKFVAVPSAWAGASASGSVTEQADVPGKWAGASGFGNLSPDFVQGR